MLFLYSSRRYVLLVTALVLISDPGMAVERTPNVVVIFTDDQGYADLGAQQIVDDIKTPNLDRMASEGVRCTHGYITAPQCSPSRAGLLTGRYQQRFGLNHIPECPLPLSEVTLADRLQAANYTTGMVGKWHLEPNALSVRWARRALGPQSVNARGRVRIPFDRAVKYYPQNRGFDEVFKGQIDRFWANYSLDGSDLNPTGEWIDDNRFRLDVQSDAAVTFINRHKDEPFFLYVAYFAPHTPLAATEEYLKRHPGEMKTRRRYALAMLSAVDDGVGRILETLTKYELDQNTIVFYTSDNGAPLDVNMPDLPIDTAPGSWDGSLNHPLVGEKGMLSEGGIRVPFLVRWPGTLPAGKVYNKPVISLDIAATAIALAGIDADPSLDGVNLIPYLTGQLQGDPHESLFWRFWNQTAIRKGNWKYLKAGNVVEFLFDLSSNEAERENLIGTYRDKAVAMREELDRWSAQLRPIGTPDGALNNQEQRWYNSHFGLKPPQGE